MMKKSNANFSSNSNDSELEIFIDANERELIRQNEPGFGDYDEYEGINSNVDLIKFEESMEDKQKRNSVSLNSSITDNVNGGFVVDTEHEEKREVHANKKRENVTFDAKGD